MKIVQVHNYYQQAGGEDAVVEAERLMLEAHGHQVVTFYRTNDVIAKRPSSQGGRQSIRNSRTAACFSLLRVSVQTIWNWKTYREFSKLLKLERPDVVHCHNTFPLISPSIYWACAQAKVAVVQTLHNYRLLCLNAFLYRKSELISDKQLLARSSSRAKINGLNGQGSICELCVSQQFKFSGVRYGCYRDSKAGSLVVAVLLFIHRVLGTWSKKVDCYIALTEFQKNKMVEGGLPAGKISVKPNFTQRVIDDASLTAGQRAVGSGSQAGGTSSSNCQPTTSQPYALFVGRLSAEKGCTVLLKAWDRFQVRLTTDNTELTAQQRPQLLIVGGGEQRHALESLATQGHQPATIHFVGKMPNHQVLALMRAAQFLILPSVWHEGFPMNIVESFACGTAVVASDNGGMTEIIVEKQNGLKFELGNEEQLSQKISWAFDHPDKMDEMGSGARQDFEQKYSAEMNHSQLIDIYRKVVRKAEVLSPSMTDEIKI